MNEWNCASLPRKEKQQTIWTDSVESDRKIYQMPLCKCKWIFRFVFFVVFPFFWSCSSQREKNIFRNIHMRETVLVFHKFHRSSNSKLLKSRLGSIFTKLWLFCIPDIFKLHDSTWYGSNRLLNFADCGFNENVHVYVW